MVSPTRVSATSLIEAVMKPNSPGPISSACIILGVKKPVRSTGYFAPVLHHADGLALLQDAVDDAHQNDDAEIGVVPAVDQHGLQRLGGVALARRRQLVDDRLQHVLDADAGLGRNEHGLRGVDADHFLDLLADALGLGGRQVDLVQDHHDLVVVVDRLVDVGQASAPRRPARRRRPAASLRRPTASATLHRRSRHGPACRSG